MRLFTDVLMGEVQDQIKEKQMEAAATRTIRWYAADVIKRLEDVILDVDVLLYSTDRLEGEVECILKIKKELTFFEDLSNPPTYKEMLDKSIQFLIDKNIKHQAETIKEKYKNELLKEIS